MDIFYSDKETIFKCKITIEGASIKDSFVRLLLKFGDISYLFQGNLNADGKCKVKVPALKNTPSDEGDVILEVITDSTFFEPYTSKFNIKRSKSVSVVKDDDDDDLTADNKKPKVSVVKESQQKTFTEFYSNFTKLKLNESLSFKNFRPKINTKEFVKNKLGDVDGEYPKIFMYYIDNILKI